MERDNTLFDSDALLFVGRPYWFDKPSQAEGEDF